MIIKPKKTDEHHKPVIVNNPRVIKARKFGGKIKLDNGYFMIKIENGLIYAGRVDKKNKMEEVVYGKSAEEIYHEIIKRGWVKRLENAAYLGRELGKADYCLR